MEKREFTRTSITAAVGCWIGFLVGPNVMIASTNSVFMKPLTEAFHTNVTSISAALALQVWLVAILAPIAGRALDRYGARKVLIPGVILFGIAFAIMSQITSIWQYVAIQLFMAVPASMHSSVGYAKVVSMWFDRNRGIVLGLCVALGAGAGQFIMPRLSAQVIGQLDWRTGYMVVAGIILLVGLPIIFALVKPPVAVVQVEGEPRIEEVVVQGLTRGEALRTATFYKIFFGIMLASMSLLGTLQHSVAMLSERGMQVGDAANLLSTCFLGVILGEFSAGFLVNRFNTPRVILPFFVIALVGLLIMHTAAPGPLLIVGGIMMGMGLGGEIGQNAYLVSRYFGLRNFGSIYGLTFAASNLGIGVGLILMGAMRDITGSYDIMRYIFGATMTVSVLCIASLGPFPFVAARRH